MSDDEILAYIATVDAPVVGASEIAGEFGFSTTKGARLRLKQLEAQGLVRVKKLGRVGAWWLTDAGEQHVADA